MLVSKALKMVLLTFMLLFLKELNTNLPNQCLIMFLVLIQRTQDVNDDLEFSSNCILNYLYGELEGKKIKNVTGPITFGEIGYMLLNQTLTFLYIENK